VIEGLFHLFALRRWSEVLIDVVDIALVTLVVYRALLVLRGTRAVQMGTGLGVIAVVYFVAKWLGFVTLVSMLSSLLTSIILVVVVVFQNDIRRGLMRVGFGSSVLIGASRQQESRVIDEVVLAVTELARHRTGAIICFEQAANLDEFVVGQGTVIDAAVQRDLLVSLFLPDPHNKLHDGAVVLKNLRIAKAGVFFPMPDTKMRDKSFGTRHRAALGITEETDAVVVVVSEERGTISICFGGNIIPAIDEATLRQALTGLFGKGARAKKKDKPKEAKRLVTPAPSKAGEPLSMRVPVGPVSIPPPKPRPPESVVDLELAAIARPMPSAGDDDTPQPREVVSVPMPESVRVPAAGDLSSPGGREGDS
jgi:uncharacterized protein (TIGR00159 family)